MNDFAANALQNAIGTSIQAWLQAHPIVFWAITHPLYTLIILLVLILLLWGILGALAQLVRELGLAILKAPFQLGQGILNFGLKSVKNIVQPKPKNLDLNQSDRKAKLEAIWDRLEAIQKEQAILMRQAQALIATEAELKSVSATLSHSDDRITASQRFLIPIKLRAIAPTKSSSSTQ
ncbi:MAG: hypothetical protein F6K19_46610 [Cyanothece sp. SIO1E1]|nr:hypothetical protein [Cyanothece sp. SIO1E1]